MQLSDRVCSASQSCPLHCLNTHLHSEGSWAYAVWPGHNQCIHRYHAFKGRGGQTSGRRERGWGSICLSSPKLLSSSSSSSSSSSRAETLEEGLASSHWNAEYNLFLQTVSTLRSHSGTWTNLRPVKKILHPMYLYTIYSKASTVMLSSSVRLCCTVVLQAKC